MTHALCYISLNEEALHPRTPHTGGWGRIDALKQWTGHSQSEIVRRGLRRHEATSRARP